MKKSQILAALALAFALGLGVVAPIANTYAVEYTGVVARTSGEATGAEVEAAINFVKSNATYNKIAAVAEAVEKYSTGYALAADTTVDNFRDAMGELNDKFVNGKDGTKITAGYDSNDTLAQLAQKASKIANFSLYSDLIKELNATPFNIATVKGYVQQMNALGITNVNVSTWGADGAVKTAASVKTALGISGDTSTEIANYDAYASLVKYVNNVNKYGEAYDKLTEVLSAALKADSKALDNIEKFTTTISTLRGKATNDNIADYDEWEDVYEAVVAADGYTAKASTANYDKVMDIAEKWAIALPDNDNSAAVIAEVMMGYKGGAQTPNNPETPNEGDNNGDNNGDDTQDPSAPGTGIVSSSEANAATTVSIVAGLATALTALGAGVVAYRSARRSNK